MLCELSIIIIQNSPFLNHLAIKGFNSNQAVDVCPEVTKHVNQQHC